MELIRKEQEDEEKETRKDSNLLAGLTKITKIAVAQNASMAAMIEAIKGSTMCWRNHTYKVRYGRKTES